MLYDICGDTSAALLRCLCIWSQQRLVSQLFIRARNSAHPPGPPRESQVIAIMMSQFARLFLPRSCTFGCAPLRVVMQPAASVCSVCTVLEWPTLCRPLFCLITLAATSFPIAPGTAHSFCRAAALHLLCALVHSVTNLQVQSFWIHRHIFVQLFLVSCLRIHNSLANQRHSKQ